MTRLTKITVIICSFILIVCIGLFFVGNFFYNLALNPKSGKQFLNNNPDLKNGKGIVKDIAAMKRLDTNAGETWFHDASNEEMTLTSYDGLSLQGYHFRPKEDSKQWVVVAHGYMSEAALMGSDIKMFVEQGYHVLAIDLRGHGKSEGTYIGMGWHDRKDILGWINQIIAIEQDAQIVLYGVSMGGATVMMTAGENLPSQVKAIIEDCGYTSAKEQFSYQLKRLYQLPCFPIIDAASLIARIRAGYSLDEANALKQLEKSQTPMLFIHGDQDLFVPSEMVYTLYEAAPGEKELLIIEGAGHAKASSFGDKYWNKVWTFISKYLTE